MSPSYFLLVPGCFSTAQSSKVDFVTPLPDLLPHYYQLRASYPSVRKSSEATSYRCPFANPGAICASSPLPGISAQDTSAITCLCPATCNLYCLYPGAEYHNVPKFAKVSRLSLYFWNFQWSWMNLQMKPWSALCWLGRILSWGVAHDTGLDTKFLHSTEWK